MTGFRILQFAALVTLAVFTVIASANGTWKPEYAEEPLSVQQWFKAQKLMLGAAARFGFSDCCANAERFRTKFDASRDGWSYFVSPLCVHKGCPTAAIPADTVHPEEIHALNPKDDNLPQFKEMRVEGVLMLLDGEVTCFWPPQPGI